MVQSSRTGNRSECCQNLEKGALWRGPPDRNGGLWSRDIGNLWVTQQRARGKERHPNITLLLSPDLLHLAFSAGFTHQQPEGKGADCSSTQRSDSWAQGRVAKGDGGWVWRSEEKTIHDTLHLTLLCFLLGEKE